MSQGCQNVSEQKPRLDVSMVPSFESGGQHCRASRETIFQDQYKPQPALRITAHLLLYPVLRSTHYQRFTAKV